MPYLLRATLKGSPIQASELARDWLSLIDPATGFSRRSGPQTALHYMRCSKYRGCKEKRHMRTGPKIVKIMIACHYLGKDDEKAGLA